MSSDSVDTRRKHQLRSSSAEDEIDRSPKRRRHRHHSHRRHRHGTKKRGEERKCDFEIVERGHTPDAGLGSDSHPPEYDVEEGEILEEEGLGGRDGEIGKKETVSDAESGEIQVTEDKPTLGLFDKKTSFHKGDSVGIYGKDSKNNGEDISSNKFVTTPAMDGEDGGSRQSHIGSSNRSSVDPQDGSLGNGYLEHKSSREDRKQKGNEKLRGNYDHEDLEVNGFKVGTHRNSSSESAGEKCRTLGRSPSCDRHRSHSRSSGYTRDRSHSRSIVEEYVHSKRRHSGEDELISYSGRDNTDYNIDEVMRVKYSRNHGHGSRGLEVDVPREHSSSYSSIYTGKEDRHYHQESRYRERSKERDVDRGFKRERERGRSKNRELDWVSRREREQERSHERDRREVEKESRRGREVDRDSRREKDRDRSWDTVVERVRRREKERDSRDRIRGGERNRDRESELDDKNWDRNRMNERDRRDDRNRHKDRGMENDKSKHLVHRDFHESQDTYRHSRHSRLEETEHHRDRTTSEPQNSYSLVSNSLERGEDKIERCEHEQDDLDEKLQLAEQEEEDLIRIKEESRRRREAILEKYKRQQQEVEQIPENEDKDKGHVDVPAAVPEVLDGNNDVADVYEAETSFSIGKSPQQYENADTEKVCGAGGLGKGTPKSERSQSDDKFCDDIFGETPTGVRKSGKGGDLRIGMGGLYDNWDDAEGYYSYRLGEILDGRYEVTAAHGRGVFSTVVRAKNLKSGNGEPEEVAIKIIRNNDTMYKAGMDELVILKKLVGADPDDKRHCVRFLSSFKYRNHLCLVFESLNMNLREVLKKFGRNIGLRLTAVRAYAKQLFIALKHLRNCGVLHCDIKPDNMLVNEAKNVLKLCDFGNAMFAGKNEVTPYLVSRFYRAPEIILGLLYDHPLDMWSVGCCLYELYTGKVLFPGPTNNDMLRLHMELKGPFPKKMLRKGAFIEQHFDQDLNFLATDEDPVTKKTLKRVIVNIKPKDFGTMITGSPGEDPKMLVSFKDLLEKIFVLDPDKRLTVSQALNHPFITGK